METRTTMKIRVDLDRVARRFRGRFMTPKKLAREMVIDHRVAGRILAKMEKLGYAVKWNTRTWRIVWPRRIQRRTPLDHGTPCPV